MAFDTKLADAVGEYLDQYPHLVVEKKKMFGGLAFMLRGKMCVNVSGDRLMCRFDPSLKDSLTGRKGFEPMIMNGRQLDGYCYVAPEGFRSKKDFSYWIGLCLEFNERAKSSKKK